MSSRKALEHILKISFETSFLVLHCSKARRTLALEHTDVSVSVEAPSMSRFSSNWRFSVSVNLTLRGAVVCSFRGVWNAVVVIGSPFGEFELLSSAGVEMVQVKDKLRSLKYANSIHYHYRAPKAATVTNYATHNSKCAGRQTTPSRFLIFTRSPSFIAILVSSNSSQHSLATLRKPLTPFVLLLTEQVSLTTQTRSRRLFLEKATFSPL